VTDEAGVGDTGFGLGVTVADYDNDGFPDLFVNNFGPNVLYRNNGDGTFTDVTNEAEVTGDGQVGAGACFLDIDADGDLDLYAANYVKFTIATNISQTQDGHPVYVGPRSYPFEPDLLYRNNGDGTFTDISAASGIAAHAGSGMGMVCCDYDGDGDTDAFVLNDVSSNYLFENDGAGNFREVALMAGTAYNGFGDDLGSMGVDCGDYDNDGWPDFLMTSYQGELPVLYRNRGDGTFEDVTVRARVGTAALRHVNWGVGFVDFDNDGHRDIFMACGHLQDNIHLLDGSTSYHARNILLANNGDGTFTDVSAVSGDGMRIEASSRGAAFDDLDNDGQVDAVILNSRREPSVLRNQSRDGPPLDTNPSARHPFQPRRSGGARPGCRGRSGANGRSPQRARLPEPLGHPPALRLGNKSPRGPARSPLARRTHPSGRGSRSGSAAPDHRKRRVGRCGSSLGLLESCSASVCSSPVAAAPRRRCRRSSCQPIRSD
jgi:enediyne biosynthesis protein E4